MLAEQEGQRFRSGWGKGWWPEGRIALERGTKKKKGSQKKKA